MDAIDDLLYSPASFVCDKCGFCLEKRTIVAATGRRHGPHDRLECRERVFQHRQLAAMNPNGLPPSGSQKRKERPL